MATSEANIRIGVSLLLNKYGALNTSEVKKLLNTVIPFDSDDKRKSKTRNEMLILQRIGNIVSHQNTNKKIYLNSYMVDKTNKPAQWILLKGLKTSNTLVKISSADLKKRKKLSRKFKPKKIDWQKINNKRSSIGIAGEDYVFKSETKRVSKFAPQDINRIIHLSQEQGDGAGYDIISLEKDGSSRYIEVKTTDNGLDYPFYMSQNEKLYFDLHKNDKNLFIYRVYNFDINKKKGKIKIIPAADVVNKYSFNSTSYEVSKK